MCCARLPIRLQRSATPVRLWHAFWSSNSAARASKTNRSMELPATLGKYELLEFLGGGMSHVYRARDTVIDRAVVVKILTDDSCKDADAKARFLQEAKLAGGFQHENIVSVFDYGEFDG